MTFSLIPLNQCERVSALTNDDDRLIVEATLPLGPGFEGCVMTVAGEIYTLDGEEFFIPFETLPRGIVGPVFDEERLENLTVENHFEVLDVIEEEPELPPPYEWEYACEFEGSENDEAFVSSLSDETSSEVDPMDMDDDAFALLVNDLCQEYAEEAWNLDPTSETQAYACHLCGTRTYLENAEPCVRGHQTGHNQAYIRYALRRGRARRVINHTFCGACHKRHCQCSCPWSPPHLAAVEDGNDFSNPYFGLNIDQSKDEPNYPLQGWTDYLHPENLYKLLNAEDENFDEWMIKLTEDLVFFYWNLAKGQGVHDVVTSCMTFLKFRTTKALCRSDITKMITNYYIQLFGGVQLQSFEDHVNICDNLFTNFNAIKNTEFFKKIHRLSMFILSYSLFDNLGINFDLFNYSMLDAENTRKKFTNKASFAHCIVDTVLFLLKKGFQILRSGDVQKLFHSASRYEKFFDESQDILRKAQFLNNPQAHGFNEFEFLNKLNELIEQGECIRKNATSCSRTEQLDISRYVNNLIMIKMEHLTKSAARESRIPPFSILVYGESNIGKSFIKDMLFYHYGKVKSLPIEKKYCYTRNHVEEFWNGFTTDQWCVNFDDVAFMHPNKAQQGDPSVMEIIQVINAIPFVPNQADLSDKGRTPLKAKLVIATTNTEDLNAHYYFSHPSAVQRRFPYIIVPTPKEEYQTPDGSLDSSMVPPPKEGCYQDLWTWTVKKVQPSKINSGQKKARIETILDDVSLVEFLKFYNEAIKQHDLNQNKVVDATEAMSNIVLCPECQLPSNMCDCPENQLQSLDDYLYDREVIMETLSNMLSKAKTDIDVKFVMLLTAFTSVTYFAKNIYSYVTGQIDSYKASMRRTIQKEFWRRVGNKIYKFFNLPAILTALAAFLAGCAGVYKFMMNLNFPTQSSSQVSPEAMENERENVWFRKDYDLSKFEVPEASSCWGESEANFLDRIERNTASIAGIVPGTETGRWNRALCLEGNYWLVNAHFIPQGCNEVLFVNSPRIGGGVASNIRMKIDFQFHAKVFEQEDICILHLPQLPQRKSIMKYFAREGSNYRCSGVYVSKDVNGNSYRKEVKALVRKFNKTAGSDRSLYLDTYEGIVKEPTINGDCGSTMIARTPKGPVITGIHCAGLKDHAISLALTYERLREIMDSFLIHYPVVEPTKPELSAPSAERALVALHQKSVFRYLESGTAEVYGTVAGCLTKQRSNVTTTLMMPFWVDRGVEIKYTAPSLRGWEPWRKGALDLVNPITKMDIAILDICAANLTVDIVNRLHPEHLAKLEVYDDFTAVNGAQGVAYVDSINRSTSAGFPWRTKKTKFLEKIAPFRGLEDPVELTEEITTRMREIEHKYLAGERAHPVFNGCLKDEPVTFEKRKLHKTRIFAGAPVDWSIVVRKYFLSFIRVLQNNRMIFEAGPGTIAQSNEWGDIYIYLTRFGKDRIVAGDYSKFDKRMNAYVIQCAFRVIIDLYRHSGKVDEDDIKIMEGISIDTAFPLMCFNGDLVQFNGSNPSGHPLTVIINGLVNSIYMRYAYMNLNPNHELSSFKQNVNLFTYGDDNILGVSKDAEWFNHTAIQELFASVDLPYTMADKTAASVPFINIDDASFLKRKWRWNDDLMGFLCPLEEDSIHRSLTVWTASKTICKEEQAIAVLSAAHTEYFNYGREIFEEKAKLIQECIDTYELRAWITSDEGQFPNWERLIIRWKLASGIPMPESN